MTGFKFILTCSLFWIGALVSSNAWSQTAGRDPDAAFDTVANRFLVVFEQDAGSGTEVYGEFHNPDGSLVTGGPTRISDPRNTQGCFYGQFDEHNGEINTPAYPEACPLNKNPAVAYNNGQFMIVWEVSGTASAPSSSPDNSFINIFAQIVDAGTLNPLPGWEEGILISKVFIAANNADSRCGDKHACNDGQIQAWSQSINPDVAPRLGAGGFVVTWQTNRDFIGCADPSRRQAWSVYGRYVDQSFSATSTTNPPMFAVYQDDSTLADKCEPQNNVDNGANSRIAFNQATNDFVIVYEVARASGGNASIGAKRVTINAQNLGEVNGSIMPGIIASVAGANLTSPEVLPFKNIYYLFAGDGTNIRGKSFSASEISNSAPDVVDLGAGDKSKPHAASNLGAGGTRPGGISEPERMVLAYEQGGNIQAAVLNETLGITRPPVTLGSGSTNNRAVEAASDYRDFVASWVGDSSGEKVLVSVVDSADISTNNPPTAPGLLTPNNGVTFAPTRAYLSWNPSTDPDGDTVTYNIYFGETSVPSTPQATGITATDFVIGPETQSMTGITLQASKTYQWKIEADDGNGGRTSSGVRTLNTDNSVVGWWRFDDNPALIDCGLGEAGSETVCDYSGNGNHGVPNGGVVWLPPVGDILGRALDFDGVDDFIQIQDAGSMNPTSVSIQARFKSEALTTGPQHILDKRRNGYGYDLRLEGAGFPLNLRFAVSNDAAVEEFEAIAAVVNMGTYYISVGTYEHITKRVTLYNNGVNIGTHLITGSFQRTIPSPFPAVISNRSFAGASPPWFNGVIDEAILFNKELSAEEVQNNYNSSLL